MRVAELDPPSHTPLPAMPEMPAPRYLTRAWCTKDEGVKCSLPFLWVGAAEIVNLSKRLNEAGDLLLPITLGKDSFTPGNRITTKAFGPTAKTDALLKQARSTLLRHECVGLLFFGPPVTADSMQWRALSLLHFLRTGIKDQSQVPNAGFAFFPRSLITRHDGLTRHDLEEMATALTSFSHALTHDSAQVATRIPDFSNKPFWKTVRLEEGTGEEDVGDRLPWRSKRPQDIHSALSREQQHQDIHSALSREGRLLRAVEHERHAVKEKEHLRASRLLFCIATRSGTAVHEELDTPTVGLNALPLSWKLFQDTARLKAAEKTPPPKFTGHLSLAPLISVSSEGFVRGAVTSARHLVHNFRMREDVKSMCALSDALIKQAARVPGATPAARLSDRAEESSARWWEDRKKSCEKAAEDVARALFVEARTYYWPEASVDSDAAPPAQRARASAPEGRKRQHPHNAPARATPGLAFRSSAPKKKARP